MPKETLRNTLYFIENFADGIPKRVPHTKNENGVDFHFLNKEAAVKYLMQLKNFDSGLKLRVKETTVYTFNDWV